MDEEYDWFGILIYGGALIALYAAFMLEYKDLYCPCENQSCKLGNGASFAEGKAKKGDDFHTLLAKIRISSRYDEASVYWRRCIIFAVLLAFSLLIIVFRRFPTAYELLASFILIYLFSFLFLVYYQETVSKPATAQINELTSELFKMNKHSDNSDELGGYYKQN
jgi:hypothetical protein